MHMMKTLSAVLLVAATFAATPSFAVPNVCLRTRDIQDTISKDGKILTFRMKDGTVLRNHLKGQCNGLIFNGFVWVVRGDETVCENAQSLQVLQSGEVCTLGKFDPPTKEPPHARS